MACLHCLVIARGRRRAVGGGLLLLGVEVVLHFHIYVLQCFIAGGRVVVGQDSHCLTQIVVRQLESPADVQLVETHVEQHLNIVLAYHDCDSLLGSDSGYTGSFSS